MIIFIFSSIMMSFFFVYTLCILLNKDKKINKEKIISFIILCIYLYFSKMITDSFIRPIITYAVIVLSGIIIERNKVSKVAISAFISWMIVFISEFFVAFFIMGIQNLPLEVLKSNFVMDLLANIFIVVFAFIFITTKILREKLKKIVNKEFKTGFKYILLVLIFSAIALSIIFYLNYFKLDTVYTILLSLVAVLIYSIIITNLLKEKYNNDKFSKENKLLKSSLTDYEKLYEKQRIDNHENRNQLLVIRSMVNSKNKKLLNYIDQITDIENKDNKSHIEQLRKLPSNVIRGLINFKIIEMEENRINFNLYISNKVNYKKLSMINDELNFEICKLLGIYLDNAIQCVKELKERIIDINIYEEEDSICFDIANNFDNKIELDKINKEGYSTKGKGHGYGLSIAKKVIENSKFIKNETIVSGSVFRQKIKCRI